MKLAYDIATWGAALVMLGITGWLGIATARFVWRTLRASSEAQAVFDALDDDDELPEGTYPPLARIQGQWHIETTDQDGLIGWVPLDMRDPSHRRMVKGWMDQIAKSASTSGGGTA